MNKVYNFNFFGKLLAFAFTILAFSSGLNAEVSVTVSTVGVCDGGASGSATANPEGGWEPYTYKWSNGATTRTINNLTPGDYSVTVVDKDGAIGTSTGNVPNGLSLDLSASYATCASSANGTATVGINGGTAPFDIKWSDGQTFVVAYNLAAGNYSVTVTDANGCQGQGNITVENSPESIWLMPETTEASCGECNGTANPHAMLGVPPYTYLWSDGQTTENAVGLCAGTYTVTVTDQNGCSNSAGVVISSNSTLSLTTSTTDASCNESNGTATVTPQGGSGDYTYAWSNGGNTATVTGLNTGTYTVTVSDRNCTNTATVTINNGDCCEAKAGNISTTDATTFCADNNNTVNVNVNGNSSANGIYILTDEQGNILSSQTGSSFTFTNTSGQCKIYFVAYDGSINGVSTGQHINNVSGDCYEISSPIEINKLDMPDATIKVETSTDCGNTSVGLSVTPVNGATYNWTSQTGSFDSTNGSSTTYTNTTSGNHPVSVSITLAGGCSASDVKDVTISANPNLDINKPTDHICGDESIQLDAVSNISGYDYTWSATGGVFSTTTGATTDYSSNTAGSYTITMTASDPATGCTYTQTTEIGVSQLEVEALVISTVSACGESDGELGTLVTGGSNQLGFDWSNGTTTSNNSGLPAGTFTVEVTDNATGCTASTSIELEQEGTNIGNYVWYDNNENCTQDDNERGVENVPVYLMGMGADGEYCTADDNIVAETITDENGHYLFSCVEQGVYYVKFFATVIKQDYKYTCIDGTDDLLDSDAHDTGKTDPFTVNANGSDNLSYDAGITKKCNALSTAGVIGNDQEICAGDLPSKLISIQDAGGIGNGPIEYLWMKSSNSSSFDPNTWEMIPNSNSSMYQPGPVYLTTYYVRCTRREGCDSWIENNVVQIKVISCANFVEFSTNVQAEGVELTWLVGNNSVAGEFSIEKSSDKMNFEVISTMDAHVSSKTLEKYNFIDTAPKLGRSYYRIIKTVNNTRLESSIAEVLIIASEDEQFLIYPNPVTSTLNLEIYQEAATDFTFEIIKSNGDIFSDNISPLTKGSLENKTIDVSNLSSGLYFIKITSKEGKTELHKFFKK